MKSRDNGSRRPCELCNTPTVFTFDVRTKRGKHVRYADCCVPCGERPELTSKLTAERKDAK